MAGLAIMQAGQMEKAGNSIYSEVLPSLSKGAELTLLFEQQSGLVAKIPAEIDLAKQEQAKRQYQEKVQTAKNLLAEFISSSQEAQDTKIIKDIEANLPEMEKAAKKVFDYASNFAVDQAVQALNADYEPIDKKTRELLQIFSGHKKEMADHAAADLSKAFSVLNRALWVAGGVIIILLTMSGILLVRNVTRRIHDLNEIMKRLAKKDFSVSIEPRGRDEIAEMTNTVRVFKEGMQKTAELEEKMNGIVAVLKNRHVKRGQN